MSVAGPSISRAVMRIVAALSMLAKAVPDVVQHAGLVTVLMSALGLLLLTGTATRIAATAAALLMTVIYALFHAPQGLSPVDNGGVPAVLSIVIFVHLAVAGAGRWSVDRIMTGKKEESE